MRSRHFAGLAAIAGGLAAIFPGCSGKTTQAGGLEIIVATNLQVPSDFDAFHLQVQQELDGGSSYDNMISVPTQPLPASFAVTAGTTGNNGVLITVTALKAGTPVDVRVAEVQVPTTYVAELTLVLAEDCLGQVTVNGLPTCPSGESCQPTTGTCGTNVVPTSALTTYSDASFGTVDAAAAIGAYRLDAGKDATLADTGMADVSHQADAGVDATMDADLPPVDAGSDATAVDAGCAATCAGCCSSTGCVGGDAQTACGTHGATCTDCSTSGEANVLCVAGECSVMECTEDQVLCGGGALCIDPQTSATNCGASGDCSGANAGTACASGLSCVGGACVCLVTNTTDSASAPGAGSLRSCVASVPAGGTIMFAPALNGQTITLAATIAIAKNLTIQGPGLSLMTISGGGTVQILTVANGATDTLSGLTFSGGTVEQIGGGAIYNSGTLVVTDSAFTSNTNSVGIPSACGGAILSVGNESSLTVERSTFTLNSAPSHFGGAICSAGSLTITDSTFDSNNTFYDTVNPGGGGAIEIEPAGAVSIPTLVTNSTFANNTAGTGGAITNGGTVTVTNSTFTGNGGPNNTKGGALYGVIGAPTSTTTLANNIFVGNASTDVYFAIDDPGVPCTSLGYNLFGTIGGVFTPVATDMTGITTTQLALGTLGDNGGPTQTMLPSATSVAIGAVPVANCSLKADQRGSPRPSASHPNFCDIGAVERQPGD